MVKVVSRVARVQVRQNKKSSPSKSSRSTTAVWGHDVMGASAGQTYIFESLISGTFDNLTD